MKARCPHCGFHPDFAGAPTRITPVDGDLSFCPQCGQWAMYDLVLRRPTLAERRAIASSQMCRDVEHDHLKRKRSLS